MPHCSETTSHRFLRQKGLDVKPADEVQHPSIGKRDRAVATVTLGRDARDDATIRMELLRQSAQRLIPLSELEAESMVTELHAEGAHLGNEHVRRMLAHVLVKLSEALPSTNSSRWSFRRSLCGTAAIASTVSRSSRFIRSI